MLKMSSAEELKKQGLTMKERLKVYDDELHKAGMEALEGKLGSFEARQFLHRYYIRRFMECRGRNYTKWRQENDPWAGMSIEDINREAERISRQDRVPVEVESEILEAIQI
jgi:hypothetical protein